MTAVIQIGNSDNKLTQSEWAHFVAEVRTSVEANANAVHFHGFSPGDAPWQNAAWIVEANASAWVDIVADLRRIRESYRQDSVAVMVGNTTFV